jgi:hypothetical protein
MGIEHIAYILNKPTDRGYIAHAHATRTAKAYHRWPKEAREATKAILYTLQVLSYIRNIPGAELENIKNIYTINHTATSIRAASATVDQHRETQRRHVPKTYNPKTTPDSSETNVDLSDTQTNY